MLWIAILVIAAIGVVGLLSARWFASVPARDIAQGLRAFIAAFGALAGTGLIYAGRFGLAIITIGAAIYAVRAMRQGKRPPDPFGGDFDGETSDVGDASEVRTASLVMRLDHSTGTLDGSIEQGSFAGRMLSELSFSELMSLRRELAQDDAESVSLLDAFLDRNEPEWRGGGGGDDGASAANDVGMDEEKALAILGLDSGASEAEVRRAHKELMARLHPDRGGSTFLASQINAARAFLLKRRGSG